MPLPPLAAWPPVATSLPLPMRQSVLPSVSSMPAPPPVGAVALAPVQVMVCPEAMKICTVPKMVRPLPPALLLVNVRSPVAK